MLIWYLARGAGIAAFLAFSVATGVGAYSARRSGDAATRVVWQYVHRAAALSGVVLILLHVITLLADSYAGVGPGGLLPFGSAYKPFAVTLGVLSLYAIAAVAVTGMLRSRMASSPGSARLWRRIHLLAYAAWPLAAAHFLLAGTDSLQWWSLATLAAGTAAVVAGVAMRLSERNAAPGPSASGPRPRSAASNLPAPAAADLPAPAGATR